MNFLFLTSHFYPFVFGAELFAQKIAEDLVKHHHQVHLVTGLWDDHLPLQENYHGINIFRLRSPRVKYLTSLFYISPQYFFAQYLATKYHYDFVHAHIYPSLFNGWKISGLNPKPTTLVTIQGGDLGDYPDIYGPFSLPAKFFIGRALSRYHTIHTVSNYLSSQVKSLSGKPSLMIPNGIDIKDQQPLPRSQFSHLKTKYLVISPSRLTEKNNLINSIKAIKLTRDQSHLDIGFLIVGDGHLQPELLSLIASLKAEKYVQLIPAVSHDLVLKYIKSSDCLLRPSLQEGFGIALLEGMSLNIPVIATTNGGLADFVSSSTAFVSGTDELSIADQLHQVFTSSQTTSKVKQAYKLASQYSWDSICSRVRRELYHL